MSKSDKSFISQRFTAAKILVPNRSKFLITLQRSLKQEDTHTHLHGQQVRQLWLLPESAEVRANRKVQGFGHFLKREIPTSGKIFLPCVSKIDWLNCTYLFIHLFIHYYLLAKQHTWNCWLITLSIQRQQINTSLFTNHNLRCEN